MKEKYISRVDSEKSNMYGYLVRLYKGSEVLFQKWISDNKYGGKEKALKSAISIRDQKIKDLNYLDKSGASNRTWRAVQKASVRSNTGYQGIYESREMKRLKDGTPREHPYFAVSYVEERGKPRTKKFYITAKRGREETLKLAIEFRKAREMSARAAAVEYNRALQKRLIEAENKVAREQEASPKRGQRRRVQN